MIYAYAAIALVIAALGGWATIEHQRAARYQAEAIQWQAASEANAAAVEEGKRLAAQTAETLAAELDARTTRIAELENTRNEILSAPPANDGPVARVLLDALDRMRGNSADSLQSGAPEGARRIDLVPKAGSPAASRAPKAVPRGAARR